MKLRKDTVFDRAALSQEWRLIVPPEEMGEDGVRKVVLSIPFGADIHVSLLADTDQKLGSNRSYKGPIARPGADVQFHLRAGQTVWACTAQGTKSIGVIIEFLALEG
jgi:hypothetical protein